MQVHVDHVEGWVWGVGKAVILRRDGAGVYVGDHVHDVAGALELLRAGLAPGDVVLVKASRSAGLERVAAGLLRSEGLVRR